MRYYELDNEGYIKGDYARPQPNKNLLHLEEPVGMAKPRWDGNQWVDDVEAALHDKRARAKLDREQFMLALKAAGIYGQAMSYARSLPEDHDWRIRWEHSQAFNRNDPDLIAGAKDMGLTDSDLDAIFGIT